jgi:hypothetical protein
MELAILSPYGVVVITPLRSGSHNGGLTLTEWQLNPPLDTLTEWQSPFRYKPNQGMMIPSVRGQRLGRRCRRRQSIDHAALEIRGRRNKARRTSVHIDLRNPKLPVRLFIPPPPRPLAGYQNQCMLSARDLGSRAKSCFIMFYRRLCLSHVYGKRWVSMMALERPFTRDRLPARSLAQRGSIARDPIGTARKCTGTHPLGGRGISSLSKIDLSLPFRAARLRNLASAWPEKSGVRWHAAQRASGIRLCVFLDCCCLGAHRHRNASVTRARP